MDAEQTDVRRHLTELIGGVRRGFCIRVLALYRIPDHISDGRRTTAELAEASGLNASLLERVLRVMADIGFLERDENGTFTNSALSDLLRSDTDESLRNFTLLRTDDAILNAWMRLPAALEGGDQAFQAAHGMPIFQYLTEHPELKEIVARTMAEVYQGEGQHVAKGFDFGRFDSILDVGGGLGHILAEILAVYKNLSGGVFDLPVVADNAGKFIHEQGLSDRCSFIEGSFFESVPDGYEAYFLKSVIHDWKDEEAIQILKKCRESVPEDGRLLICEQIYDSSDSLHPDRYLDLEMLVLADGKERTESEFDTILNSSGFERVKRHEIENTSFSVIEARPV